MSIEQALNQIYEEIEKREHPKHPCRFYGEVDGEKECEIKMDMTFCGKNCAFNSANRLSTKPYGAPRKKGF